MRRITLIMYICGVFFSHAYGEDILLDDLNQKIKFPMIFFHEESDVSPEKSADIPAENRFLYTMGNLPKNNSDSTRKVVFSTYFRITEEARNADPTLFIGPTDYPADIYLNGVRIYRSGRHVKAYNSMTYASQAVLLPIDLLHPDTDSNVLTIQIFPTYETHPLFRMYLSSFDIIQRDVFIFSFLNYNFTQASMVLSAFIFFFFLLLYLKGGAKEIQYFYFSMVNLFYGLAYANISINFHSINEVAIEMISRITFPILVCFMVIFVLEYTKVLHKSLFIKIILFSFSLIMAFITLLQPDKGSIHSVFSVTRNLLITPMLLFIIGVLVYAVFRKKKTQVRFLLFASLIQALTGIYDSFYINLMRTPVFWLVPYGYSFLIVSIFIILAIEQSDLHFRISRQKLDLDLSIRENELRKETEEKLRHAKIEAEQANKAKSLFLANMSHEIRTPLNAILGFASLLSENEKTDKTAEYAEIINSESRHLLSLVNNVLDLSKIESGHYELDISTFKLRTVFEKIAVPFQQRCSEKGIDFLIDISSEIPEQINGDAVKIQQVVVNLLENALKFTDQGSITLHARMQKELVVSIKDTGIGIARDKLEKIFDTFVQADSSTTRKYGGTGLGITISQQLVHLMGGDLTVKSKLGMGSEFIARIPVHLTSTKGKKETLPQMVPDLSYVSILIVEDNKTNRKILEIMLEKTGCIQLTAVNGQEGIAKFKEFQPDMILMDVQMPVLDGYEATKQIRSFPGGNGIPIIGLTANVFEQDKQNCLNAGMTDVLTKPVQQSELFRALYEYCVLREPRTNEESISFIELRQELDLDLTAMKGLLQGFLDESRNSLSLIEVELEKSSWEGVHREAHSIKGGALNVFATRIYRVSRKIENLAKSGKLEGVPRFIPVLKKELSVLADFLDATEWS